MPIFAKTPIEKSRHAQRLEYNYLLKRKLAIGVYTKIVEQIASFEMSGQWSLNCLIGQSYDHLNIALFFSWVIHIDRVLDHTRKIQKIFLLFISYQ